MNIDSLVIRGILEILIGAPTSQLLFMNEVIDSDDNVIPSISFIVRDEAQVDYSCYYINEVLESIFVTTNNRGINITDVDDIVYPSLVSMWFVSHVATLICLSLDEIYYVDYYQELKRDTKDRRSWGLNYFLYKMNVQQLRQIISSISQPDYIQSTRQFLGCNPLIDNRYDRAMKFDGMVMYSGLINYDLDQFYNLLQSRRQVIEDMIINDRESTNLLLSTRMAKSIGATPYIIDLLDDEYTNVLVTELRKKYDQLFDDIKVINQSIKDL